MLPYWLKHHLPLFDHGILIDHNSTDDSVDVCRALAPYWTVVKTALLDFNAIDCDFEVMKYEEGLSGWKMALAVTEFVHHPDLRQYLKQAELRGAMCIRSRGVIMVDRTEDVDVDPSQSLTSQKHHGYIEEGWRLSFAARTRTRRTFRNRIIHRHPTGGYVPGRHQTFRPIGETPEDLFTLWYGYSPWIEWYKLRKTSFAIRIPEEDKRLGFGAQHLRTVEKMERDYRRLRWLAYDLRHSIPSLGA